MAISRRRFLGWMGAAGTAAAGLSRTARAATGKDFQGYPDAVGVLHDTTLCVGCRSCEAACNQVNGLPAPEKPFKDLSVLKEDRRTSASAFTVVNRYEKAGPGGKPAFRKIQCNHCLEPACASACFVKAFKKSPEGPVDYDASLCVGCRYCMVACPFEIPAYEYDKAFTPRVMKCTLCHETRLKKGLIPACVESCPVEALVFGKRADLIRTAWLRIESNPGRYQKHLYGEHEMGGTSWLTLSGAPFEEVGMRTDLGTTPAPRLTAGALSAVPIVAALWPVFLTGMYAISKRNRLNAEKAEREAVAVAVAESEAAAGEKLAGAMEEAKAHRERAIEAAVRNALAEEEEKRRQEQEAAASGEEPVQTPGPEEES